MVIDVLLKRLLWEGSVWNFRIYYCMIIYMLSCVDVVEEKVGLFRIGYWIKRIVI